MSHVKAELEAFKLQERNKGRLCNVYSPRVVFDRRPEYVCEIVTDLVVSDGRLFRVRTEAPAYKAQVGWSDDDFARSDLERYAKLAPKFDRLFAALGIGADANCGGK